MASDDSIAWSTAFWFWKTNVIGGQYGQQVLNGEFGYATRAVNGGLECGSNPSNPTAARNRFQIYTKVLMAFDIDSAPIETGCYD